MENKEGYDITNKTARNSSVVGAALVGTTGPVGRIVLRVRKLMLNDRGRVKDVRVRVDRIRRGVEGCRVTQKLGVPRSGTRWKDGMLKVKSSRGGGLLNLQMDAKTDGVIVMTCQRSKGDKDFVKICPCAMMSKVNGVRVDAMPAMMDGMGKESLCEMVKVKCTFVSLFMFDCVKVAHGVFTDSSVDGTVGREMTNLKVYPGRSAKDGASLNCTKCKVDGKFDGHGVNSKMKCVDPPDPKSLHDARASLGRNLGAHSCGTHETQASDSHGKFADRYNTVVSHGCTMLCAVVEKLVNERQYADAMSHKCYAMAASNGANTTDNQLASGRMGGVTMSDEPAKGLSHSQGDYLDVDPCNTASMLTAKQGCC